MPSLNKTGIEIERKFLIHIPSKELLETFDSFYDIEQTYLKSEKGHSCRRIRKVTERNVSVYYYCEKSDIAPRTRTELESLISEEQYLEFMKEAIFTTITKTRYLLYHLGYTFEIDIYPFWSKHAIMEIELSSADEQFTIPSQISVVKEVTDDPRYKNYSLAQILHKATHKSK